MVVLTQIVGIDLAALPKNPTGFAVINDNRLTDLAILHGNEEIINRLLSIVPTVIAVDAPLTRRVDIPRECDRLMKKYGAMPLKLKSISKLALRAMDIVDGYLDHPEGVGQQRPPKIIEAFPTGTAKIMEIYTWELTDYKKNVFTLLDRSGIMISDDLEGPGTKDELDAVLAAFTGWLHQKGLTISVGDRNGSIVIPDKNISISR